MTDDDDDVAADADLDVLPGAPKVTEEMARAYINHVVNLAGALHKAGVIVTDAVVAAELEVLKHYPNVKPLSKAVITSITKHVLLHTKRGVK